jgi:hypothetical protein
VVHARASVLSGPGVAWAPAPWAAEALVLAVARGDLDVAEIAETLDRHLH